MFKLRENRLVLLYLPNPIYSDDTSVVTVTIIDENGVPVVPATAMTVDLILSGTGFLSEDSLEFNNVSVRTTNYTPLLSTEGIITITATGASFTGSIDISVELKLEADHIELNADPFNIPADEGNSSSTITATIKNSEGITVHNYNEDVTFSIISGGGTLSVIDGVVTCLLLFNFIQEAYQVHVKFKQKTVRYLYLQQQSM